MPGDFENLVLHFLNENLNRLNLVVGRDRGWSRDTFKGSVKIDRTHKENERERPAYLLSTAVTSACFPSSTLSMNFSSFSEFTNTLPTIFSAVTEDAIDFRVLFGATGVRIFIVLFTSTSGERMIAFLEFRLWI